MDAEIICAAIRRRAGGPPITITHSHSMMKPFIGSMSAPSGAPVAAKAPR